MIKILIADDHAIVREGLKRILGSATDMAVSSEASTGQEVVEKVTRDDFDVLVLDISMPGRNGLDILRELRVMKPKLHVLMLSMFPEEQYAVRVIRAGASGYMTKDSAPDELVTAIRRISQGRKYVSPSLAERLAADLELGSDQDKPPHELLSDREFRVMCMMAAGTTANEIAEELMLSVKTISTYRTRVLRKMRMKSSAELTHYAIKHGLVD
jgi:two-component system invasion response regulator UvrY